MPLEYQIVPEWKHSHVMTVINDNTIRTSESLVDPKGINALAIFIGGQGIDNTFVSKESYDDFVRTFGTGDFTKYGQPIMMPMALLSNSDNVRVTCMRVMPSDAMYSNAIISLLVKDDITSSGNFQIKIVSEYRNDINTRADLENIMVSSDMNPVDPDVNGFYKTPILGITPQGRGTYGDKYRVRLAVNKENEADKRIKMYTVEALNSENGLTKVQTVIGSLVYTTKYSETTQITDLIDDADEGSAALTVVCNSDAVEAIYNQYKSFMEMNYPGEDIIELDGFDPLFGLQVNSSEKIPHLEIITESVEESLIVPDAPEGISLAGGSEGSFALDVDPQVREDAITQAYVDAFSGVTDRTILTPLRVPADFLLDANYPYDVKVALAALANAREDCILYLDAGIISSSEETTQLFADYYQFNTRTISKDFQHYKIRDPISNRKIAVTMTYQYACWLPTHWTNNGFHIPFVRDYAILKGHVRNSLRPAIEIFDSELKESLYDHRFNYWEATGENEFVRSCQNTSQNEESDLLEENNMNTLYQIKRGIERDVRSYLYSFASETERTRFKEYEEAKYLDWAGSRYATMEIRFESNEWETENSILHCYLALTFRTLNKRIIVEIDINPRATTN